MCKMTDIPRTQDCLVREDYIDKKQTFIPWASRKTSQLSPTQAQPQRKISQDTTIAPLSILRVSLTHVERRKLPPATLAFHGRVPTWIPAAVFWTRLLGHAPRKGTGNDPSTWGPPPPTWEAQVSRTRQPLSLALLGNLLGAWREVLRLNSRLLDSA